MSSPQVRPPGGRLIRRVALAVGIVGALAAAAARRPLLRRWPVSVLQAVPAGFASEAPRLLATVHAVAGAAAVLRGARAAPRAALAGAAANAAALAGMVDLHRDTARSAAVLETALAPLAGAAAPAADETVRVVGGRVARRRYRREADVPYGDHPAHRLDIWARPDLPRTAAAPVLVQVHGGAWSGGDKVGQGEPLMAYLAAQGWVCVTVNYRLGPAEFWPAMIVDVKRAIAWVRRHVAEFGGDPEFLAISGGSAGGHLAALAAVTPNDPDFQPGFAEADTTLAAAVPFYGVHDLTVDEYGLFALLEGKVLGTTMADDERSWRQASPVHRAGPDAPPFLVLHGSTDTVASVGQSRRLVRRLREVSRQPVLYAELPRAQHGFDIVATERTAHAVRSVHRFLSVVHERHRARARDGDPGDRATATGTGAPSGSR